MQPLQLILFLVLVCPVLAHDHVGSSMGVLNGKIVPENRRVLQLFEEAVAARDRKDYRKMLKKAREAGDKGSVWAGTLIGEAYMFGLGVPQDHKEAMSWVMGGALSGDYVAMQHLGILYLRGKGVEHDRKQARYWFQRLVDGEKYHGGKFTALARRELAQLDELDRLEASRPKQAPVPTSTPASPYRPQYPPVDSGKPLPVYTPQPTPFPINTPEPIATPMYPPTAPPLEPTATPSMSCSRCQGRGTVYRTAREAGYYTDPKPGYSGTDSSHYEYNYHAARTAGWDPCPQCNGAGSY